MLLACRLLFLLRTGPGTAAVAPPGMLLSMCPPMQPFARLPVHQREAILQWWSVSPIPLMKKVGCVTAWLRMRACVCRVPCAHLQPGPVSCKHSVDRSGRTPVGLHLGQSLTCSPFWQTFRHKHRMSCWLADRKQLGRCHSPELWCFVPHPRSGVSTVGAPARGLG